MSILVTGGAKGFGREVCLQLAKKGHPIVVHYRKSEREADETVEKSRALGVKAEKIQGDFETVEGVRSFAKAYIKRFPETKGIVNNVGNYQIASLSETPEKEWFSLFQTNVHAPFMLIRALLPSLKKHKGQVVNIGVAGLHTSRAHLSDPAYLITKRVLFEMTRAFAKELAPFNVRVNMVSPGHLETTVVSIDPRTLPMKRFGTLEETAKLVAYLLEEDNAYLTGQNIEIAGGVNL